MSTEETADYKPPASVLDRMTEAEQRDWRRAQAKARYIARLSLQRNPYHPSERELRRLQQIPRLRAAIAQDLAAGRQSVPICSCAADVRRMLDKALVRDVKFWGRGLGVCEGYSPQQIKRILKGEADANSRGGS